MIILSEVAAKLESILNSGNPGVISDSDIPSGVTNPVDFLFRVATAGFHIDKVADMDAHRNFIPVFISSMGGAFNPVEGLGEATYNIPVVMYFPVRFKNEFFVLNQFLVDVFVGRIMNYGPLSGRAVSNLSVAQFGEIQDLDFKEFKDWVNENYHVPIEKMEPYMSMQLTLYLSTANSQFVYGNEAVTTMTYKESSQVVKIVENSIQSQTQSISQQILGEQETAGVPYGVGYGTGFAVYIENNDFFKTLLQDWYDGKAQTMKFTVTTEINILGLEFSRDCYLESVVMPIRKGQLLTATFSFAKMQEDDEEDEE